MRGCPPLVPNLKLGPRLVPGDRDLTITAFALPGICLSRSIYLEPNEGKIYLRNTVVSFLFGVVALALSSVYFADASSYRPVDSGDQPS